MNSIGAVQDDVSHDRLSFDELSQDYNFLNFSSFPRLLTNLILGEITSRPGPARVLDIGCGRGIGRQLDLQREVAAAAGEFWGLEPDATVQVEEGLFENFQHALMETADLPENHFDLAYSSMVMEHVEKPEAFLAAVQRCLMPGGVYLFLTPNALSLVPRITKICHDLRIDEFVLRLIRGAGKVEQYHYPVQYKFNTPRQIESYAARLGFQKPQYAYIEGHGGRSYFPGPLRLVYGAITLKRKLIKNPRRLSTLICRLVKTA